MSQPKPFEVLDLSSWLLGHKVIVEKYAIEGAFERWDFWIDGVLRDSREFAAEVPQ
jgi:hypothetical protein